MVAAVDNRAELGELVVAAMGQPASATSAANPAGANAAAVGTIATATGPVASPRLACATCPELAYATRPVASPGLAHAATGTIPGPFLGAVETPCPSEFTTALPVSVAVVPAEHTEVLASH